MSTLPTTSRGPTTITTIAATINNTAPASIHSIFPCLFVILRTDRPCHQLAMTLSSFKLSLAAFSELSALQQHQQQSILLCRLYHTPRTNHSLVGAAPLLLLSSSMFITLSVTKTFTHLSHQAHASNYQRPRQHKSAIPQITLLQPEANLPQTPPHHRKSSVLLSLLPLSPHLIALCCF